MEVQKFPPRGMVRQAEEGQAPAARSLQEIKSTKEKKPRQCLQMCAQNL